MEKKRKLLADEKRNLDTEAALDISERKRKMMGQVAASSETPSKSKQSTSQGSKFTAPDISTIPGPKSPPTVDIKGKGPEGVIETTVTKKVPPPVIPGVGIQERVEGLETYVESSEANPPGTQYTWRVPSDAEGRGRSDAQGGLGFE
ncbi:hypothetical protein Hanom_Chr07g00629911 [Helianthus anomalus]